jgi:N6-adenosine-specific RNA methylase IME4
VFIDIYSTNHKYRTIYADPPWPETGGGNIIRGAQRHFKVMRIPDIIALPVSRICEDNCHLYLWVTNNHLPDGLKVMESWGFRYVTIITWVKDKIGLGQYFRSMTLPLLFGVRGRLPYKIDSNGKRIQGRTAIFDSRGRRYAEETEKMREMIEMVSYPPGVELFARSHVDGWDCWGDEV